MWNSGRIQPKSSSYVKDEPGSLSAVPCLRGRVQALGLGWSVCQVLLVPIPAWLNVVQIGYLNGRSGVLLIFLHLLQVKAVIPGLHSRNNPYTSAEKHIYH